MNRRRDRAPDARERRQLFRRMEWLYVWAPPLMILLVAGSGSAVVAWIVPITTISFWGRWAIIFVLVTLGPLLVYLIRSRFGG